MYFGKYIDLVIKKFYSNARYTSSFFYTLKFFFDKNTKTLNTVAKLGNVYRSSKWVDLRMQNIKVSVSTRYLALFGSLFFLTIICYMEVSLFSTVLAAISKITLFFADSLYYSKVFAASILHYYVTSVKKNMCIQVVFTHSPRTSTSTICSSKNAYESARTVGLPGLPLKSMRYHKHGNKLVSPLLWNFYRATSSLAGLANSRFTAESFFKKVSPLLAITSQKSLIQFAPLNSYFDLNRFHKKMVQETAPNTIEYIQDYEAKFYGAELPSSFSLFRWAYSFLPNSGSFARIGLAIERGLMANQTNNAAIGKENRWMWKSNVFSNTTSSSLNAISKLKKFVNNPLFSGSVLNKNLWTSSKATESIDIQSLSLLDGAQQITDELGVVAGGNGDYRNINFMEDSMLWNLNRFSNFQNMQTMHHLISNTPSETLPQYSSTGVNPSYFTQHMVKLALSYNFTLTEFYSSGFALKLRLSTPYVPHWYASLGTDLALINYNTTNLIGGCFSTMSPKSKKFLYFENLR